MDEKKQYRVKPGFRHGAGGKYGPGDIVELTEYEAGGFLDKLEELVTPAPEETPPAQGEETPPKPGKGK